MAATTKPLDPAQQALRKLVTNRMSLLQAEDHHVHGISQSGEAYLEHCIEEVMQAAQRYALVQQIQKICELREANQINDTVFINRVRELEAQLAHIDKEKQ